MKTWTNPTIEELEIKLTATVHGDGTGKGDETHCEEHWSNGQGNGHSGECGPDCKGWTGTPMS